MPALAKKGVMSTGQVSRICKVAPRTVSKWIDSGALEGYRIPGGRERRVTEEAFEKFVKSRGLPDEWLGRAAKVRALIVGFTDSAEDEVIAAIKVASKRAFIRIAGDAFEAGVVCSGWKPTVAIVNSDMGVASRMLVRRGIESLCPECRVEDVSGFNPDTLPGDVIAAVRRHEGGVS